MKEVYRKVIQWLSNTIVAIDKLKVWTFEWIAIIKKRDLYKDIKYTNEQNEHIEALWKANYGRMVSKRWHKLYQSINGVYNEYYFPEIVFSVKLEPKINPSSVARFLSDKSLTELIYQGVPEVKFPTTIAVNCSGILYDKSRRVTSEEKTIERMISLDEFVIKPIIGESSGNGVQVVDLSGKSDLERKVIVQKVLAEYEENYIVQLKIKAQKEYEQLHPYSINTIRLITYIAENRLYHAPLCLRVGCGGNRVDNIHAGGVVIGVSDEGVLKKYGYQLGYGDSRAKYTCHPDTGIVFENYEIPKTHDMIEIAKQLHGKTPHLGIVSWDFTVDNFGNVVLIEGNYYGQSIWFPQIVHGEPIFGEKTAYFMRLANS